MSGLPNEILEVPSIAIDDCWNRIGVAGDASCPELKQHIHCRNCPVYSAAAATLLQRDLPPGHLAAWSRHFAQKKQIEEFDTQSVVIFRISAEWIALPTSVFQEVGELRPIHSLPHRRVETVLGLANVRGELLICVSLGKLLGLEEDTAQERKNLGSAYRRLVVIQHKDWEHTGRDRESLRVAFPADEVHGVHRHHPQELREVPATLAKAAATYTKAMLPWRGMTVGCLDDELIFHTLSRSIA